MTVYDKFLAIACMSVSVGSIALGIPVVAAMCVGAAFVCVYGRDWRKR